MKKYIVIFSTVGLLLVIVGYFIFKKEAAAKYYSATTLEEAIEGVKSPHVRTPEVVLLFMDDHSQEDVLKLIQLTGNVRGYWVYDTALTAAARLGYLSVVKYLIEQGLMLMKHLLDKMDLLGGHHYLAQLRIEIYQ